MKRPIATLNIPVTKIREIHSKGFIFCDDINLETIKADIGITADEWNTLTKPPETKTALDLCEDDAVCSHIVTFSNSLDTILGGGVPFKMITEITGMPGTGKTQLCLQLCASVQVPDCFGGIEGKCVYVDTNLGFTPRRLSGCESQPEGTRLILQKIICLLCNKKFSYIEMATGCIKYCQEVANTLNSFEMYEKLKTLTEESFLKGLQYIRLSELTELIAFVLIFKQMLSTNSNIKLVVIDSITNPIKNSTLEYFERIQIIYTFLAELQKLAHIYKFAIVLTNDMTTKFDENGESYVTPCLGDSFAHRINNRIKLERVSDIVFKTTNVKNVLMPVSSANFHIVEAGIRDIS